MRRAFIVVVLVFLQNLSFVAGQDTVNSPPEVQNQAGWLSDEELDSLLGPVALYPDPLLAALLPAATRPTEIVMATRYLNAGGQADQMEALEWSESAIVLAYYPDVLRWLDENLEWTTEVGRAFIVQPAEVMESIQRQRRLARALGNLESTPLLAVEVDTENGDIDLIPADPDYFYLPCYQADFVYKRPAASVVGSYVSFGPGRRMGSWFNHDWDWKNRRVVIWSKANPRPRNCWTQPRAERFRTQAHFQEWCPRPGKGQSKWWSTRQQQATRAGSPTLNQPQPNPAPQQARQPARAASQTQTKSSSAPSTSGARSNPGASRSTSARR